MYPTKSIFHFSVIIMTSACCNYYISIFFLVNKSVCFIDSSAPPSCQIVVCFKLPHAVRVRNQLTAKLAFYRLTNHVQTSIMGFFVYIPGKNTQSVRTIFPMVAKNYHIQGIFCQVPCKTFSFIQNSSKTARRTPY